MFCQRLHPFVRLFAAFATATLLAIASPTQSFADSPDLHTIARSTAPATPFGEGSTCSTGPEVVNIQELDLDKELASEIGATREAGIPEHFAAYIEQADTQRGLVVEFSDGTTTHFVQGFSDHDSVGISRKFAPTGELVATMASKAKQVQGKVELTQLHQSPTLESTGCKEWDRACQREKLKGCAVGGCTALIWNPAAAAICALNLCGINLGSCCTKYISPGDDLGGLHD